MTLRSAMVRPFRQPWGTRWLAFLAGGLQLLVFPAPNLEFVAWFGLVPGLVLMVRSADTHEAWVRAWWFGAGYLVAGLYWMAPEVGPGLLLIGAVAGVLWVPFGVSARLLLRPPVSAPRALAALVVVPSCWLLTEWLRSWQALGGPWDVYGASQWQHPAVLALAAVGGVWLISFALALSNAAIMLVIGAIRPRWLAAAGPVAPGLAQSSPAPAQSSPAQPVPAQPSSAQPSSAQPAAAAAGPAQPAPVRHMAHPGRMMRPGLAAAGVIAIAASVAAGPAAFAMTAPFPAVRQATISMVQPGPITDPKMLPVATELLTASLSKNGELAGAKPDLIVWGESSEDGQNLAHNSGLLHRFMTLSAQDKADILVNQDAVIPGKGKAKVAVLISGDRVLGTYFKTRLVPFGEYIPFRQQLGWLTRISKAASNNMEPGNGAHLLHPTDRAGRPLPIGVLICFESAFPDMSRVETDQGAQLIVYQSATSTFQGTWGPDQHASLAALRAAETGRPVVQAALTGDTVAFDGRGREIAWMGQSGRGVVNVRLGLPSVTARTPYDMAGDYVPWFATVVVVVAALVMAGRKRGYFGGNAGVPGGHAAQYEAVSG